MIAVENLTVVQGDFALRDVDLQVPQGQYAVLMGRTGCGKTTLLEAICGLRRIRSGAITLADQDVTWLKPAERGIGYVPQDSALFSTMTVREHLAFALVVRKVSRQATRKRIAELADLLGIGSLLHRKPEGLSGGERQRVALGRALSFEPPVLLLDEPLSALDEATRGQMHDVLRRVSGLPGVTTLHITHNREDALELADALFVFEDGAIKEQSL